MKTLALFFHSADFDGLGCYAVCRRWAEKNGFEVSAFPFNYGEAPESLESILCFDLVFVGDVCLPAHYMKGLKAAGKLIWVDHHATAIADAEKEGFADALGLRRIGVGACELSYEFFYPDQEVPKVISMLSAYDVFDKERFDWDGLVLPFQFGMRNHYGLDKELFYADYCGDGIGSFSFDNILNEGRLILDYVRKTGYRSCLTYSFEVIVNEKYRALCMLTGTFGSIPMEAYAVENGYDIIMNIGRVKFDSFKVSLFAANGIAPFDLGAYLKERYEGGGHHDAAGCNITKNRFFKLMTKCRF